MRCEGETKPMGRIYYCSMPCQFKASITDEDGKVRCAVHSHRVSKFRRSLWDGALEIQSVRTIRGGRYFELLKAETARLKREYPVTESAE